MKKISGVSISKSLLHTRQIRKKFEDMSIQTNISTKMILVKMVSRQIELTLKH